MKVLAAIFFLFSLLANTALSQNPSPPCQEPEATQFDFWLGTWDISWVDAKGNQLRGVNTITKTFNGCVIEENFNGRGTPAYLGRSHSMFDRVSRKWKQTWVDNAGAYLDLTGEFADGKMILTREFLLNGKKIMQRMTFLNIEKSGFDWLWERSDDEGKTWKTNWKLRYSRKLSPNSEFSLREVKDFIDAANRTYEQRFHKKEDSFWNERYTSNACTMPPNGTRICGRDKIRDYFYGNGNGVKLSVFAEDVSGGEELVVETGNYTVADVKGVVLEKGKFIATWRLENGMWKMQSEIWNSDLEPPKPR